MRSNEVSVQLPLPLIYEGRVEWRGPSTLWFWGDLLAYQTYLASLIWRAQWATEVISGV